MNLVRHRIGSITIHGKLLSHVLKIFGVGSLEKENFLFRPCVSRPKSHSFTTKWCSYKRPYEKPVYPSTVVAGVSLRFSFQSFVLSLVSFSTNFCKVHSGPDNRTFRISRLPYTWGDSTKSKYRTSFVRNVTFFFPSMRKFGKKQWTILQYDSYNSWTFYKILSIIWNTKPLGRFHSTKLSN